MFEADIIRWLTTDSGFNVHVTIFALLLLGGVGFPIPEDLPVLLGGVAAAKNVVSFHAVFLICYSGVMIGDMSMYLFGRFFGQKILDAGTRSPFFPGFTDEKIATIRDGLRKRRLLYIFIGRHLFPIRSLTFVTAGAVRVPFLEFLIADAIAALVSVAIMLWLGYLLGGKLTPEMLNHLAHELHYYIIGFILIFAGLYYLNYKRLKRRQLRSAKKAEVVQS